jgi:hypothetical protein
MPLIVSSGWQRQIFKLAQAGRSISVLAHALSHTLTYPFLINKTIQSRRYSSSAQAAEKKMIEVKSDGRFLVPELTIASRINPSLFGALSPTLVQERLPRISKCREHFDLDSLYSLPYE